MQQVNFHGHCIKSGFILKATQIISVPTFDFNLINARCGVRSSVKCLEFIQNMRDPDFDIFPDLSLSDLYTAYTDLYRIGRTGKINQEN